MTIQRGLAILLVALLAMAVTACGGDSEEEVIGTNTEPDVEYIPTPQAVVDLMLEMADVDLGEVVYDLGSGDGRIPITAARELGARGLGIEIQPQLIQLSRQNAEDAGVDDRVEFLRGDLFELDMREADIVTMYLLEELNLQLRPKLLRELDPGSRIVSNTWGMGSWEPDRTETIDAEGREWTLYMWEVPAEVPQRLLEVETATTEGR
jgi:SAM-dependent methyltransferase